MGLFTNYKKVRNKLLDSVFSAFIYYAQDLYVIIEDHPAYLIELLCYISASVIIKYHNNDIMNFIEDYCKDLAVLLDGQIKARYKKAIDMTTMDMSKELNNAIRSYVIQYVNGASLFGISNEIDERALEYQVADLYKERIKKDIDSVILIKCSDKAKELYKG